MKSKSLYTGINIQWPISELILNGSKTIETRTYPIPEKYLNKDLVMVETPGKSGQFKARCVAIIKFTNCFKYQSENDFYHDKDKHHVSKESLWRWEDNKPKWGWKIVIVKVLPSPQPCKSQGIVYRKNIEL